MLLKKPVQQQCISHDANIVAVMDLQDIKTCFRCSARVEPATPPFVRCSKILAILHSFTSCVTDRSGGKLLFNSHRNPTCMIILKVRDSIL